MVLTIPDEVLRQTGMTERELLVEAACRLFAAEKITLPTAGKIAGLPRVEMEAALRVRQIPIYRPTVEEFEADLRTLERMQGVADGRGGK